MDTPVNIDSSPSPTPRSTPYTRSPQPQTNNPYQRMASRRAIACVTCAKAKTKCDKGVGVVYPNMIYDTDESSFPPALDARPKASSANQDQLVALLTTATGKTSKSPSYHQSDITLLATYLHSFDTLLPAVCRLQTEIGQCVRLRT
jgi:hypothetical protein